MFTVAKALLCACLVVLSATLHISSHLKDMCDVSEVQQLDVHRDFYFKHPAYADRSVVKSVIDGDLAIRHVVSVFGFKSYNSVGLSTMLPELTKNYQADILLDVKNSIRHNHDAQTFSQLTSIGMNPSEYNGFVHSQKLAKFQVPQGQNWWLLEFRLNERKVGKNIFFARTAPASAEAFLPTLRQCIKSYGFNSLTASRSIALTQQELAKNWLNAVYELGPDSVPDHIKLVPHLIKLQPGATLWAAPLNYRGLPESQHLAGAKGLWAVWSEAALPCEE